MKNVRLYLIITLLMVFHGSAFAQYSCPENIDFEQGAFTNWQCATGTNNVTTNITWTPVSAISNRHSISTGNGSDPYGGFPVVAPGGGTYSIKLGNNTNGAQMDRVRYTLAIPTNINNFNLIYRYAVVLEDAGHTPSEQPYFRVSVTDSATGVPIPCNTSNYISNSNLPGFVETSPRSNIWYKDWTANSLKLAGQAGRTLYVEFVTADCSLGGHFGYGYVDVNCGGYSVTSANCNGSLTTPLVGPAGFQQYEWYDAGFANHVGTGRTVIIPSPAPSSYYQVVLTPYPGYGCIDTLITTISYATLAATAAPDTSYLCGTGTPASLSVTQTGSAPPFTYSWTPRVGLSCATCANPTALPTANTLYAVAVTDAIGCTVTDTVVVNTGVILSINSTNVTCFGAHNGTLSAVPTGGKPPYTFIWNTTPVQYTAIATGLAPGSYSVSVTDSNGCTTTLAATITQPLLLHATSTSSNIRCNGLSTGQVSVTAMGGISPYTYAWNTTPVSTSAALSNLRAGAYTCTITDSNGCTTMVTQNVTEPPPIVVNTLIASIPCTGTASGMLIASTSGGLAPLTYNWGTFISLNDTLSNLLAGRYIVTVTDASGCYVVDTTVLNSYPLPLVTASQNVEICLGDSTSLVANGALTYSWQPANFVSCATCPVTTASPTITTPFILTGTDTHGCISHDTVTVAVIQRVPVSVDTTRYICPDEQVALGAYGGEFYEWTPAATLNGPTFSNPVASPKTTITYRVIITQNRCFKDTLQQQVVVMPKPSIQLGADFAGIPGATVTLETQVTDAQSIAWVPPAGLSCADCYAPIASLDTNISYIATVTNSYGCKASDTINIRVSCDGSAIYMANTFTPNNDGQNDFFYPQGLGLNSVKRFMIYDRWGEIVFSATDIPANVPERGWNGIFKNKELAPDVFLFVMETICKDGSPIIVKGDITLVR